MARYIKYQGVIYKSVAAAAASDPKAEAAPKEPRRHPGLRLTRHDLDKMGIIRIGDQVYTPQEFENLEELHVPGTLNLNRYNIRKLPKKLAVGGNFYLQDLKIRELPRGLKVWGSLFLEGSSIRKLPSGLEIGHHLHINGTKITELPSDLVVDVIFADEFQLKKIPRKFAGRVRVEY